MRSYRRSDDAPADHEEIEATRGELVDGSGSGRSGVEDFHDGGSCPNRRRLVGLHVQMPATALALALGAAFLHAFWNLLVARAPDIEATTAVALLVGIVAFAPVTALAWDAESEVLPFLLVTALLQLAYFVLLTAAYGRADLSFVYPIARGSAPVIVLVAALVLLGEAASVPQVIGVLTVAAGVILVRGLSGGARAADLALALAVGCCIAAYTLVDSRGIQYASPIVYQELSMIPAALGFLLLTLRRRGRTAVRRALGPASVAAGLATFGAYILVLAALARAPAAPVAAVRETSVVIATLLAVPLLHERVGPARLAGAGLVVVGVLLLAI